MIRWAAAAFAAMMGIAAMIAQSAASEADYPPNYRGVFISDCTASGATAEDCQCLWSGVTERFTVPEYDSLDAASRQGVAETHPLMPRLQEVVNTCAAARNSNGYSDQVRMNFVNACTGGGGAADVCECGYRHISYEYTFAQFLEMDEAAAQNLPHPTNARVQQIMSTCRANPYW